MFSIIICTYNRDKYIYNALRSIAENDFPYSGYEIVIINNNSTDTTEQECARFHEDFLQVNYKYFVETNQGLSYARNRGIKEAQGDILVYVDDDAFVNKEYLSAYSDFFEQNPDIAAAGGAIIPKYETKPPKWMSRFTKNLITGYLYYGTKIKEFKSGKYPGGGNAAYRKEIFEKVGLFNVDLGRSGENLLGAEEKDIFSKMNQMGMSFFYLPNAILYHIISERKLTDQHFNSLTYAVGRSERIRTLAVSRKSYYKRVFLEGIKWGASIVLFFGYISTFFPQKGWKLLVFRKNVTMGLIKKH